MGDGALSRAEAQKSMPGLARHFDALDANKDGAVSRDELQTALQKRGERARAGNGAVKE